MATRNGLENHQQKLQQQLARGTLNGNSAISMNGFRITGYPSVTSTSSTPTLTTSAGGQGFTIFPTATGNTTTSSTTNKINNAGMSGPFVKNFKPPIMPTTTTTTINTTNDNLLVNHQRHSQQQQTDYETMRNQLPPSSSSSSSSPPPPPPQLTAIPPPPSAITTAPIALKGNNPFLNSPSPTENTTTASCLSSSLSLGLSKDEFPEYAEPQRFRLNKPQHQQQQQQYGLQRPHSIAVDVTTTGTPTHDSLPSSTARSSSTLSGSVTIKNSLLKTTPATFIDYNVHHQQQQQQQQQRLLQLTQQQQKIRNAMDAAAAAAAAAATSSSSGNERNKEASAIPTADKEILYAAIYKQYRNSPSRATNSPLANRTSVTAPPNTTTTINSTTTPTTIGMTTAMSSADINGPQLPLHRNQQQSPLTLLPTSQPHPSPTIQAQQAQHPFVPRRSHSTPRPLKPTPLMTTSNGCSSSVLQHKSNDMDSNGPRPRSLDRYNGQSTKSVYQPPPIPMRRFARNMPRNTGSPQPSDNISHVSETTKFVGQKSTSIDNIRTGLTALSVASDSTDLHGEHISSGMRHSMTFHGRQSDGQLNLEGDSAHDTLNDMSGAKKGERPMSYAFGSVPDQTYLENQLRAYSEQLRTITESVRKYSEQAKLLSELKRQQHMSKQPATTNTTTNNGSSNVTPNIPYSQSTGNFTSSMISPEIVGKSLASLSNCNEAQTPSSQLRLFLDNIRSTMRTEYQQHIPDEILQPIDKLKATTLAENPQTVGQSSPQQSAAPYMKRAMSEESKRPNIQQQQQQQISTTKTNIPPTVASTTVPELPTPSDQLRLFLDAIRSNKIPENDVKTKMVNSKTLDSFITKPLQMPDATTGGLDACNSATGVAANTLARRRPKSVVITPSANNTSSSTSTNNTNNNNDNNNNNGNSSNNNNNNNKLDNREHSMITSESFHQISDNLRLMSEDLKALSPSRVVSSNSSGNLKLAACSSNCLTTELRVITSTSPLNNYPGSSVSCDVGLLGTSMKSTAYTASTSSLAQSLSTHSGSTTTNTTPSTAPLMTDFNEILDSFQQMADKYKSKGSYEYLRKCSEALRQHSLQLKLQQQQQQKHPNQTHLTRDQQNSNNNNGFLYNSDDSSSCSTTPGSIREAVQNLLLQPRNGFQILDDRMRLFIDIIDSQDRFSQVSYESMKMNFKFIYHQLHLT